MGLTAPRRLMWCAQLLHATDRGPSLCVPAAPRLAVGGARPGAGRRGRVRGSVRDRGARPAPRAGCSFPARTQVRRCAPLSRLRGVGGRVGAGRVVGSPGAHHGPLSRTGGTAHVERGATPAGGAPCGRPVHRLRFEVRSEVAVRAVPTADRGAGPACAGPGTTRCGHRGAVSRCALCRQPIIRAGPTLSLRLCLRLRRRTGERSGALRRGYAPRPLPSSFSRDHQADCGAASCISRCATDL